MQSRHIPSNRDLFEEAERHAGFRESNQARTTHPLDSEDTFENLMAASWAYFEQEHARQQAMTQALREQVAHDLARAQRVDPVAHVLGQRRPMRPIRLDVIDVEAREIRSGSNADDTDDR